MSQVALDDGGNTGGGTTNAAPHGIILRIPLMSGGVAVIDGDDADLVAGYPWRLLQGHSGKLYAHAKTSAGSFYMHRLIANTPAGMETDHINGDGLDNRRENLRVATLSQNSANTGKPRRRDGRPHTSQFKGVHWSTHRRKWVACITVNQRSRTIGGFATEQEAAEAYDAAARATWGEFARLNFEEAK